MNLRGAGGREIIKRLQRQPWISREHDWSRVPGGAIDSLCWACGPIVPFSRHGGGSTGVSAKAAHAPRLLYVIVAPLLLTMIN